MAFPIAAARDRVTLQRHDTADGQWRNLTTQPIVWAAVEHLGDDRFRARIRYRADLVSLHDIEPAMRLLYRTRTLDIEDVIEAVPRREIHLIARGRQIESTDLASGARRTQTWP
jgi:head-tail adaptor